MKPSLHWSSKRRFHYIRILSYRYSDHSLHGSLLVRTRSHSVHRAVNVRSDRVVVPAALQLSYHTTPAAVATQVANTDEIVRQAGVDSQARRSSTVVPERRRIRFPLTLCLHTMLETSSDGGRGYTRVSPRHLSSSHVPGGVYTRLVVIRRAGAVRLQSASASASTRGNNTDEMGRKERT